MIIGIWKVINFKMDIASLVTVLAEGIVYPSFLMHEDISWEEIDSTHLGTTLSRYGLTVSGVFEFDEEGAILSFIQRN